MNTNTIQYNTKPHTNKKNEKDDAEEENSTFPQFNCMYFFKTQIQSFLLQKIKLQ